MNVYRSKPLTSANFKNDHIYITPFRDRLPVEVIGGTTRHAPAARFVQIEHEGSIIETYIPTNNGTAGTFFQNRTFARSFFDKTGAVLGDVVLFTEVAHLHFRLSLEKTATIAEPGLTLRC